MTRHPFLPRGDEGHTLIELSLVLLVIGIGASMAMPSMSRYVAESRVDRAIDRVASDLSYSRILAVRKATPVVLTFESATSYTISIPSTSETVRSVSLAEDMPGVSLGAPTTDSRLEFDSRGILRSVGTGTLTASDGTVTDSATLTLAGKVYRAE